MLKRSSGSVTIFSLDREKVLEKLRAAAWSLGRSHPEVEEIALFGSLARGNAAPGSDADVLVVLTHSSESFLERIARYRLGHCGIGVDVFPYTKTEFLQLQGDSPGFYAALANERITLYQRGLKH